VGVNK